MQYGKTVQNEVIFNTLRILKKINPGDLYFESYLSHLARRGESFLDTYHFMWEWVIENHPRKILEIGVRTGLSICQLLSAYIDYSMIDSVVLCDVFSDGYTSPGLVLMNLRYLNIPEDVISKIRFCVEDSKVMLPKFKEENQDTLFDYILVDGSHDPVDARLDLENSSFVVAPGGVILFDDIGPDGMNLLGVWEDFKRNHFQEFEWFENLDGKGFGAAIKK